jgi:hypothetical protein
MGSKRDSSGSKTQKNHIEVVLSVLLVRGSISLFLVGREKREEIYGSIELSRQKSDNHFLLWRYVLKCGLGTMKFKLS